MHHESNLMTVEQDATVFSLLYFCTQLYMFRLLTAIIRSWYSTAVITACGSWVKRDQLDAACFIITLFSAQHVSDVNTSILRSLRLIRWVTSWVVLFWFDVCWCYVAVWLWWCGIRMQAEALVLQPAYGYHTTTAKPQRNTNTHRTRYNPWSNSTN